MSVPWDATPKAQGLYDPKQERDACGVGAIINLDRVPSRTIVTDANTMLCRMAHRGGNGAVESDGDGCGMLMAMPDELFRSFVPTLPPVGEYGVGNLFFPQSEERIASALTTIERCAEAQNLQVVHVREIPVNNSILGPYAKSTEPKH